MQLNELKLLAAASLLAPIKEVAISGGRSFAALGPSSNEIQTAVRTVQTIWEEVLRQERED